MNVFSRKKPEPLTAEAALRYVQSWGSVRSLPQDTFQMVQNGDFQGRLRAADFQYTLANHTLVVWNAVTTTAIYATYNPDILEGLENVAAKDPGSLLGARFELVRLPWQIPQNKEPGIYLRKEYTTDALSVRQFVREVDQLRKAAYRLGHGPLDDVIRESAVRHRSH